MVAKTQQKKVCLYYLGALPNFTESQFKNWLKQMPELGIIADISPVFVMEEDTVNIKPNEWIKLAKDIYQKSRRFDGFVVLHRINNLVYTANAISFLLQNFTKPIIFTSSNLFQTSGGLKSESGIKANLINAVQIATFNLSEVGIVSGNRLVRATQARLLIGSPYNIIEAPPTGVLGKIDFSIRIFEKNLIKYKRPVKLFASLSDRVEILKISPFINIKRIRQQLSGTAGVFIDASDFYLISKDLLSALKNISLKIPVVIFGPSASHLNFIEEGIIPIYQMTREAAIIKFSWALKQSTSLIEIKKIMLSNLRGEISK